MRKIFLALLFLFAFVGQALAFNPNPAKYEFVGSLKGDVGVFYEVNSAKADGTKGIVTILYADPKNRIFRYYYNVVIDGDNRKWTGSRVGIFEYSNQNSPLDSFMLPNKATSYKEGDTYDIIYKDLLARGIVEVYTPPVSYVYEAPTEDWQKALDGTVEIIEIEGDPGEPDYEI